MAYQGSNASPRASRYFVSLQRGEDLRCVALRPSIFFLVAMLVPMMTLGFLATGGYVFFHDDLLQALVAHNQSSETAYQVRIAGLQTQLDRVSTRQLIDQETLENRMGDMASRQARLESRNAVLASLADLSGTTRVADAAQAQAPALQKRPTINPLLATPASPALPPGVMSYSGASAASPFGRPAAMPADGKPQPESYEPMDAPIPADPQGYKLRSSSLPSVSKVVADRSLPMNSRIGALAASLEALEITQVGAVENLASDSRNRGETIEAALQSAGLTPNELKLPKTTTNAGGPFVPLIDPKDESQFGRSVKRLQGTLEKTQRLVGLLPHVPLRQPLPGALEVTSPFGGRMDPFYGRAAMHTGLDLRDDMGSPVRATASGRVVSAGWNGGYGNMVEIDHGNGLMTRYAHLSAIEVKEGQWVDAGGICGRVGSTGRSTGPHLHYEVRLDGEPVDPTRFLRAGGRLASLTTASVRK